MEKLVFPFHSLYVANNYKKTFTYYNKTKTPLPVGKETLVRVTRAKLSDYF